MKKVVMLILLVSGIMNAQETEFTFNNERGMTDFIVTPVEGKTAPEIYKKVIEWIKITYKNPDKVILSTIDNEYVRFEGSSNSFYSLFNFMMGTKDYYNTKYQIEISIKDGKYKFDIISLEKYSEPSKYSAGGWYDDSIFNRNMPKEKLSDIYKKDGSLRGLWRNLSEIPIYFNNLNKSLLESMTTSIKKNDGW